MNTKKRLRAACRPDGAAGLQGAARQGEGGGFAVFRDAGVLGRAGGRRRGDGEDEGGACRVVKLVVPGLGCDDADGADPHRRQNAGSRVDARLARRIFHPVGHRAAYEMPETELDGSAEVYLHTPIQI